MTRIERAAGAKIQMVVRDELAHISRTHVVVLLAEGVVDIKLIQAELVRNNRVRIVRQAARHQ